MEKAERRGGERVLLDGDGSTSRTASLPTAGERPALDEDASPAAGRRFTRA